MDFNGAVVPVSQLNVLTLETAPIFLMRMGEGKDRPDVAGTKPNRFSPFQSNIYFTLDVLL